MSREQNGAACRAKLLDQSPQLSSRLWIESCRRLIEKEELRISYQRARNCESLFLTS
jgi:hypothetical protein